MIPIDGDNLRAVRLAGAACRRPAKGAARGGFEKNALPLADRGLHRGSGCPGASGQPPYAVAGSRTRSDPLITPNSLGTFAEYASRCCDALRADAIREWAFDNECDERPRRAG